MESQPLKVLRTDQQSRKYIVEYNGTPWPVKQVPEQYDTEPPTEIDCVVRISERGTFIEQDYATLIRRHYDVGQEQIFDIVRVNRDNYELRDAWGYTAYAEKELVVDTSITSKVRCLVESISGKNPKVEIIEALPVESGGLTMHKLTIKNLLNNDDERVELVVDLLLQEVGSELFDLRCMAWLADKKAILTAQPELLEQITAGCLLLLEESDFLQTLEKKESAILSARIVKLIENVEYFKQAEGIIGHSGGQEEVERFCERLKASGKLYHPRERFHTVMYMFLLSPELIERNIQLVFEAIRSQEAEYWQAEGIASEWIVLLEYCCRYYNGMTNPANPKDRAAVMVQALALQQILTNEESENLYDRVLNRSMLYRYASEINASKPKQMIEWAYETLCRSLDSVDTFDPQETRNAGLFANLLYNDTVSSSARVLQPLCYEGDKTIIRIDKFGIVVLPQQIAVGDTNPALPANLHLWHGLQIRVPNRIKDKETDSIQRFHEIWQEIEQQLFNRPITNTRPIRHHALYSIGDEVTFIVRRQTGNATFDCDIVVHDTIVARGRLNLANTVRYFVEGVTADTFKGEKGHLMLPGEILSINADGVYELGMENTIRRLVEEIHLQDWDDYSDYTLRCKVYHFNAGNVRRYIAYSDEGFPVSIKVANEKEPWSTFSKNSIVEVGDTDRLMHGNFIQANYLGVAEPHFPSTLVCFETLMNLCCREQYYSDDYALEATYEKDKEQHIPAEHIEELTNLIEKAAVIENDYLKAYNYFGFCRLLSKIINRRDREEYYDGRLRLIQLLYKFSDTGTVSPDEIREVETYNAEIFARHTQLQHGLYQLKLISCLGQPQQFAFLTHLKSEIRDQDLLRLSNLIIAHNLLLEEDLTTEASGIYDQILDLLKLQKAETDKKYYGEETQRVEFKTSMVYPPEEKLPNLTKQTHEILEQICAFLNCGGGTLYLGVNNSGYECGLKYDLSYLEFGGSRDKYTLYLDNQIHSRLGVNASRFVSREWDDDAKSDVLIITVRDCNQVVALDGKYYERRGTSVRYAPDPEAFKRFRLQQIGERNAQLLQRQRAAEKRANAAPKPAPAPVANEAKKTVPPPEDTPIQSTTPPKPTRTYPGSSSHPSQEGMATSILRNNVLHNYQEGFANDIAGYIAILPDGKYKFSTDELWESDALTLAIHEYERDGYLVCVYDDGSACRVPLDEIFDKNENYEYSRTTAKRLLFASPATEEDSLMSVLTNSKNEQYIRFDAVDTLTEGRMTDCGAPVTNTVYEEAVQFEIVPTADIQHLQLTTSNRSIGNIMKLGEGKEAKELMEAKGVKFL